MGVIASVLTVLADIFCIFEIRFEDRFNQLVLLAKLLGPVH